MNSAFQPQIRVPHVSLLRHGLTTALSLFAFLLIAVIPAHAHVGNKDVFETITAGPYKFFITIRTPTVIPGVAIIEVRSTGAPVTSLTITPLLLTGEASHHPPTPDALKHSTADPAFYTGSLWLMGTGSWQVRFGIDGAAGPAAASVPVPAAPTALLRMQRPLGMVLGVLGLILVLGIVGIVTAAVRESRLTPGLQPDAPHRRRAALAGGLAFLFAVFAVYLGGRWWNVEAADYAADLYHSSDLRATLTGDNLDLRIGDPDPKAPGGWKPLKTADILLDHNHLMHLYAIREPEMDAVFHLHPAPAGEEALDIALPAMPPGTYKLFGDIVYRSGFPETEVATLSIPAGLPSAPLSPEDASAAPPALSHGDLGPTYKLPDGYTMVFDRPATLTANTAYALRFRLLDATGKPASDAQLYLGMPGHAAFVKSDFSTFAHTHPDGSAAMPAVMLANASTAASEPSSASTTPDMGGMDMSNMNMSAAPAEPISPTVEFPYGFPSPGRYRIFIQMKHANTVETGVFDAEVH
jgi:hypothetical protein